MFKFSLYAVLFLSIFIVNTAKSQYVTIPDPNFVTWLQTNHPSCMSGNMMDTTCTSITTLNTMNVSNKNISSLEGVQYFDSLYDLFCGANQITSLPPLPTYLQQLSSPFNQISSLSSNIFTSHPNLQFIDFTNNNLSVLPTLHNTIHTIYCGYNQLTSIPTLPNNLFSLHCYGNAITSLPALPSTLYQLDCQGNNLSSLPSLPSSLVSLTCDNNQLTSLPTLPSGLSTLFVNSNSLVSLPTLPTGLETLECGSNTISSLPALPNSLRYLRCWNNQLSSIPTLPNGILALSAYNNPISCLPTLPQSLTSMEIGSTNITCLPNNINNYSAISPSGLPICSQPCTCGEFTCTANQLSSWTQSPSSRWVFKANGKANGGSSWGTRLSIDSRSVSDGAWVLDADSLHLGNFSTPLGTTTLTSKSMDISSYTADTLFLSFHQYYRAYNSSTRVEYTFDGGATWTTFNINTGIPNHSETSNYDFQILPIAIVGTPSSVIVRFSHTGHGYFWIIDDIKLCDQYPSPTLPNPQWGEFLFRHNYPYEVDKDGHPFVPSQLVVKSNPPVSNNLVIPNFDELQIVSSCDCDTLHIYEYIPYSSLQIYPSLFGKSISIEEKVKGAQAHAGVRSDEPNYYLFSELDNGSVCNAYNAMASLGSTASFPGLAQDNSPHFKIAILDTGIDPAAPGLASRIEVNNTTGNSNTNFFGKNTIYDNNNPLDDHGHGTHIAGILNNALTNYFPDDCNIKFDVVKTHDSLGISTLFHSACGLYCAMDNGAKVINCSWGYYSDSLNKAKILYGALKKAKDLNAFVITASGNEGILLQQPHLHVPSSLTDSNMPAGFATLDNVISVGSTNMGGQLSSFSNYSDTQVDIAAMGESVLSNGLCGTHVTKSGTSMTTAMISAAFARRVYCTQGASTNPLNIQQDVFNQCAFPIAQSGTTTSGNTVLYECCNALMAITGADTVCAGNSCVLTASGSSNFLWSTGETTKSILASTGGTYGVSATSIIGCNANTSKTISVKSCLFSPSQTCASFPTPLVSGNSWYHLTDATGNKVISVNPQGNNLGAVTAQAKRITGTATANCGATPLPRYFNLECTGAMPFATPVKVRLYFLHQDLDVLNNTLTASACANVSVGNLSVFHYDGSNEDCDLNNNAHQSSLIPPGLVTSGTWGDKGFYLEVAVNSFSEFGAGASNGATLPIELLFFNGHKQGETVVLDWATETEQNNDYFIVEKSTDGIVFSPIGRVKGNGTTSESHHYTLTDFNPNLGVNYYRLQQVDFDGKATESQILAFRFHSDFSINAYPNPFNDEFAIEISSSEVGNADVEIFDIAGRLLFSQSLTLQKGLNLFKQNSSEWSNGAYMVRVKTANETFTKALIKK